MPLIVYECPRYECQHENRQFIRAVRSLHNYFSGREDLGVFIGNINIGNALDGLIIKNDGLIIVEFKDFSGSLMARQNGEWTCDHLLIHGGANNKTVFQQLKLNKRSFIKALADRRLLSDKYFYFVHVMVVLTRLDKVEFVDFDRQNQQWITVTDIDKIGSAMARIKMGQSINKRTGRKEQLSFSNDDIWKFLRQIRIDERALITDYSCTSMMPPDLFHADQPHNGKNKSLEDLLVVTTENCRQAEEKLKTAEETINSLKSEHEAKINELRAASDKTEAELTECKSNLSAAQEQIKALTGENTELHKQIAALQNAHEADVAAEQVTAAEENSDPPPGENAAEGDAITADSSEAAAEPAADKDPQAASPEQSCTPAPEDTPLPLQTAEPKDAAAAADASPAEKAEEAEKTFDTPQSENAAAANATTADSLENAADPAAGQNMSAAQEQQDEINSLVQENMELKKQLAELQSAGGLSALLAGLKDAVEHVQHPGDGYAAGLDALYAEKEQLTRTLLQSQSNLIAAQKDTNDLMRENMKLKEQIAELKDTSQVAVLSQKLNQATATIDSLKTAYENKLNALRDDRDMVVKDLIESKNNLIAVQNNAQALLQENMELKNKLGN